MMTSLVLAEQGAVAALMGMNRTVHVKQRSTGNGLPVIPSGNEVQAYNISVAPAEMQGYRCECTAGSTTPVLMTSVLCLACRLCWAYGLCKLASNFAQPGLLQIAFGVFVCA